VNLLPANNAAVSGAYRVAAERTEKRSQSVKASLRTLKDRNAPLKRCPPYLQEVARNQNRRRKIYNSDDRLLAHGQSCSF
jgi:hypothetical protein